MALFGKSLEEKVQSAVEKVRAQFPDATINAQLKDEVVTLTGHARDLDTKTRIMAAFNEAVETKNTFNYISTDQPSPAHTAATPHSPAAAAGVTAAAEHRTHDVVAGDTLSALAKRYYGDASKYNRIFEANRDQLNDPDKIRVGQKLKIPL